MDEQSSEEGSVHSLMSKSSLDLLLEQITRWSKLSPEDWRNYKCIMRLSPEQDTSTKMIYEVKNENRFVVLKEFNLCGSSLHRKQLVRELVMGTLLHIPGLQKCSRFFYFDEKWFLEYPFQAGGTLMHFLKKAKLNISSKMHETILKILISDILISMESFWGKGFVHGNLCPGSVFLNEHSRLLVGDFEEITHEYLGVEDMLILVFYELLKKKERRSKNILSEEKEKREQSKEEGSDPEELSSGIQSDFNCLSVEGLKDTLIFSENLVLNLKSFPHLQENNKKLQYFINFFKKKDSKNKLNDNFNKDLNIGSSKNISDSGKDPNKFFKNFSFKKIKIWYKQNQKKQSLLRFRYNSNFWKESEEGIKNLIYRPPEYVEQGMISLASDIWSLGCIMYEIFYQEQLFQFSSKKVKQENLRQFIQSFDIRKSDRSFTKISKDSRKVFKKFLMRCPFERIMSFHEMDIWEHGFLANLNPEHLGKDQLPFKFKYDEQYNYKQDDFFLNSINYRISSKFKQKFEKKELKYLIYTKEKSKKLMIKKSKGINKKNIEELKNMFACKTKNLNKHNKTKHGKKDKKRKFKNKNLKNKIKKLKNLNQYRFKIEKNIWKLDKMVSGFKKEKKQKKKPDKKKPKILNIKNFWAFPKINHNHNQKTVSKRNIPQERYFNLNSNDLFSRFHTNNPRSSSHGNLS